MSLLWSNRSSMALPIHCSLSSRALRAVYATSKGEDIALPAYLVPAFTARPPRQNPHFSTSSKCQSKIGRAPLSLPPEVTFQILDAQQMKQRRRIGQTEGARKVEIQGPLGKMSMEIPPYIKIESNEGSNTHTLDILDAKDKKQKAMWGTVRAYLQNHILGVSEGHTAILRLVGVGYRATVENSASTKRPEYEGQKFVSLKVGYSHPIELGVPQGVKASCPQPTRILLEGVEKEVVMQFAAEIRAWRKPEPYKGKGIFVNDETIRLKAKKIK